MAIRLAPHGTSAHPKGTTMDSRLGMAAWLADNDGIPFAVQHLFDLSEYEAQAREIEEMTYG
jgi:hypothetical protein